MIYLNQDTPFLATNSIALDIETTGLDPYLNKLLSIAISDGTDVWIWTHDFGFDKVLPLLECSDIVKIIQTATFEYKWLLHNFKIELDNIYDTMLAEQVLQKDRKTPAGLYDLIGRYLGIFLTKDVRETFEDHPGFDVLPVTEEQINYMKDDVIYLHEIKNKQEEILIKLNLGKTASLEFADVPAVGTLEYYGLNFDQKLWPEASAMLDIFLSELDYEARKVVGENYILEVPRKSKAKGDYIQEIPISEVNFRSPDQMKAVLHNRFNLKVKSTRKEILKELAQKEGDAGKFCKLLDEHRHWQALKKFDYITHVHPITQHIHPQYHQMGTRTGRFSSSDPNLQNVPTPGDRGPNLRHLWIADSEDYVIIRVDYNQQEPRIMAQVSGDPAMLKACNSQDIYIEFGKHIFGKEIEKNSKERFIAKQFVLSITYAVGAKTLASRYNETLEFCESIKTKVKKAYPVAAAYNRKMYRIMQQYGYLQTLIGRRSYFPTPIYTQAANTVVQGTAADMFKLALFKIHKALTELKKCGKINPNTRVWNIVHDEIEVHCHKDEVDFVLPLVKELMEEAGTEMCPDVLHIAEAEYGYRWDK